MPARISLGTRLYSLVAQTDVSGMWVASRADRMRTYLAGMGMDLVLGSVLVLARLLSGADGWPNHVMAAAVTLWGTLVSLTVFAAYLLPALVLQLIRAAHHLSGGIAFHHIMVALDGAITLVIEGGTEVISVKLRPSFGVAVLEMG